MVKVLMSWDIKSGREQEYFEFVVREWIPGLQKLGVEPTDAWYTQYGNGRQILAGGTAKNIKVMKQILETAEWHSLKDQLLAYVENYEERVVKAKGSFQLL
mgnify:CR=1 FL=1